MPQAVLQLELGVRGEAVAERAVRAPDVASPGRVIFADREKNCWFQRSAPKNCGVNLYFASA